MENSLEKFKRTAMSLIEKAKEVANIKTVADYEFALDYMEDIKRQVRAWEELVEPNRAAAQKAHDEAMALINIVKRPGQQAVRDIIAPACNAWERMVESKRAADEAKLAKVATENKIDFTPSLPTPIPRKVEGVRRSETYEATVTDFPALVKAVAEGKASIDLLEPNLSEIRRRAKALGKEFVAPGICVECKTVYATAGRRASNG